MTEDAVFTAAGRALYEAHRFEHNLKGLAALVHEIRHAGRPAESVSFSRVAIGPLLDAARDLTEEIPPAESLFETARERRNALAHSLLHDRREDLATEEGRAALERDLRADAALLAHAADLASDLLRRLIEGLETSIGRPHGGDGYNASR